jgi:transcriptional regulator with XRE-family HTH domain
VPRVPGADYERTLADRIEAARDDMGKSMSEMAMALGMPKATYASKVYGINTQFRIAEVWRAAEIYRAHLGRRLTGWPWISDEDSRLLDGMLEALGRE